MLSYVIDMSFYPAPPSFSSATCGVESDLAQAGFIKGIQYSHTEQMPERAVDTRIRDMDRTVYNRPAIFSSHLSQENVSSITGPMNDRMFLDEANRTVQMDANVNDYDLGADNPFHGW
jgi:hypothetical protein